MPAVAVDALAPIRIGMSNAQAGPSASLGRRTVLGSKVYIDLVNRSGGIRGQTIEWIVRDDGYEPDAPVQESVGDWSPVGDLRLAFSHSNDQGWHKAWLERTRGGALDSGGEWPMKVHA